ncbi:Glucose dehydrogenase [FAD, quinone] [Orchesella cincta]|uniref:Glucose dehydrogenase [FAD, quinone] n=1 Tax=Orchesella cincta TaxID=48709 RepID=A0A1D2MCF3_ORCCI|nr:Glucose dehydrogenase [FAD, quinone] [Orchesella cincta]
MAQVRAAGLNLAAIPFPLVARLSFMSIPTAVAMFAAMSYYGDFLKAQSPNFYDPSHYEEFDFIVGYPAIAKYFFWRVEEMPTPLEPIPSMAVYLQRLASTDYQYRTTPQNNSCLAMDEQRSLWPRGKGLGGTSNLNFMIYQRGNPRDYDELADITGDEEWRYQNLLQFFKKSEDYHGNYGNDKYHGSTGPLYVGKLKTTYLADKFVEAAKELGYPERDLNSEQSAGFSQLDATLKDGRRWSTYEAFIRPIEPYRSNLVIYRYATVIKVHLDRRKSAYGVTYVRHGMQKFVRARREVIISAGAVDSPKLLLLSGIGPRSQLHDLGLPCRANLPVGQNLQDHVTTLVGPFTMRAKGLLIDRDLNLNALNAYMRNGEGPMSSLAGVSAVGFITSALSKDPKWPDIGYFMSDSGVHRSLADDFTRILGMKEGVLQKYYGPHVGSDANFVLVMLGKPKSVGELRLRSRSPWDKPLIDPKYFSHPDDIKTMKHAVKFIVGLYEQTKTYRELGAKLASNPFPGCEQVAFKSDAYFECYIRHLTMTIYHPSGTCAMGKRRNDTVAVVDSQLRVLKTRGLRVADTSVLRFITNANLNAPAILVGEKAAFLVRRHWALQFVVCSKINYYLLLNEERLCFYTQRV